MIDSHAPSPAFHLTRQPALDGVRGLAVLAVMAYHFKIPFAQSGFLGVDIFFTLSGFLISTLLAEEWIIHHKINLLHFYMRRILRLYPALLTMLVAISPVASGAVILTTLTYLTNWSIALNWFPVDPMLDHAWSLSVEEQYYALWPLFLILLLRYLPRKYLLLVPVILAYLSALGRLYMLYFYPDSGRSIFGTDMRADGLLLGSALGLAFAFGMLPGSERWMRFLQGFTWLSLLFGLFVIVDRDLSRSFFPAVGNLATTLATLTIIGRSVIYPSPLLRRVLGFAPLVKVGVISYGLYLWHVPVNHMLDMWMGDWPFFSLVLAKSLLSFAVAEVSYRYLEQPILRLKSRYTAQLTSSNSTPSTLARML